jgi:sugar O-acyltransferase (sialic acid O-acetyltransferase NeuD family)
MIKVVGVGAGGHAKVIVDILQRRGGYEIVGLFEKDSLLWGTKILGVPVIGGDDLLPNYLEEVPNAFFGIGSISSSAHRKRVFEKVVALGFTLITAIHPNATISNAAVVGDGSVVMAGAVIAPGAKLGKNVIVNTGAVIDHDCEIGDHVHIAPGATLSGAVQVGNGSHVGVGATVIQGVQIGCDAIVGAGAVVIADVPDGVCVVGVPARNIKG